LLIQVLSDWDELVMREARDHVCIKFIRDHQEQMERFQLLLTSTMVFPRVRRDYFKPVPAGSIGQKEMAEKCIPELILAWEGIAQDIADGKLTIAQSEVWFHATFEEEVAECAQSPTTMKELELIAKSLGKPEVLPPDT